MRYRDAKKLKVKDEVVLKSTGEVLKVIDIRIHERDVFVYLDTYLNGLSFVHHREIN